MKLIVTETILYLSFLGMDIFGIGNSTPIKFVSILLLTLSVLDFREKTVSLALILTLAADLIALGAKIELKKRIEIEYPLI